MGRGIQHGHARPGRRTSEYRAYQGAKDRCTNPNSKKWKDYGGRGILFLFDSFEQFLAELGPKPLGRSLDRINTDGHYTPGNVRWATPYEQTHNRRLMFKEKRWSKVKTPIDWWRANLSRTVNQPVCRMWP
jgi:hypothetical protein